MMFRMMVLAAALCTTPFISQAKCIVTYTFDDGLADQYTIAYQMLKESGLTATFFVIGSKVGDPKGLKNSAENDTPLMTWEQVRDMATNGMEIASHGWAHAEYRDMNRDAILDDIRRNQSAIKENAGVDCISFAPPFGAYKGADGSDVVEIAKECGIRFVRAGIKRASANMTAEDMNAIVEAAKEDGGWIVFMTHGVARGYDAWKNSEELRKHFKWIKDQKDVRVMTFSAASEVNHVAFE